MIRRKTLLSAISALTLSGLLVSFGGVIASAAAESISAVEYNYSENNGMLIRSREFTPQNDENVSLADTRAVKREYSLARVSSKSTASYPKANVYLNSTALGEIGKLINGEIYLPVRKIIERTTGARVTYNSSSRTLTAKGEGHNISVSDGAYALYASGRVLFSASPAVILSDGRMYVPAQTLAKALSLSFSENSYGAAVLSGNIAPIVSGERFYDKDAVYWLARIISAESRGESLVGQIAVGNVILNRVKSSAYPNTIWGVIFDRRYGVQFSPVANGTIYNAPTATCILAAKICLDGFSVSDSILYFLAPAASTSSWITNTREYKFSIGHHDFYA